MNEYKCETCKHGDLPTDRFPCDVCHGGSQYEPEEGTSELKSCPFCGGEAVICEDGEQAVNGWNRRKDGE